MARPTKLEGINGLILQAIHKLATVAGTDFTYTKSIAAELNERPEKITKHLNTLERAGYIKRKEESHLTNIYLTPIGHEYIRHTAVIHRGVVDNRSSTIQNTKPDFQTISQHALSLRFKLLNPLNPDQPAVILHHEGLPFRDAGLKNQHSANFRWQEHEVLFTPDSLIIRSKEPLIKPQGFNPYWLKIDATVPLFKYALDLEQKLGIKLYRLDKNTLWSEVCTSHTASQNDWLAEDRKGKPRIIVYDAHDGKARFGIDFSNGVPETEGWHEDHDSDDTYKWQQFMQSIVSGRFNAEQVVANLETITAEVSELAKQTTHLAAAQITDATNFSKYTSELELHTQAYVKIGNEVQQLGANVATLTDLITKLQAVQPAQAKPASERKGILTRLKEWLL